MHQSATVERGTFSLDSVPLGYREISNLYDAVAGTLYGLALRLCDTPEAAEEVCVRVFTHICGDRADFDPARMSFIQWVVQVMHRLVLLSSDDPRAAEQRAAGMLDPEYADDLGAEQRHDLIDAYFAGLTCGEIARRRGADPAAICKQLNETLVQITQLFRTGRKVADPWI